LREAEQSLVLHCAGVAARRRAAGLRRHQPWSFTPGVRDREGRTEEMEDSQRVLLISVRAGAGHMRAAQAIEEALRGRFPQVEVRNIEALAYTNAAYRRSFTGGYERLSRDLPSVWGLIYAQLEKKPVDSKTKKLTQLFDRMNIRPILKVIREFAPQRIVCTHYLPAEILAARRRKGKLGAWLSVVLTDYDIHTMWIQPGVDQYFVATEEMEYALRAKGVGDATVSATGIPVMPVFARTRDADKGALRTRLGLRPDLPVVIVAASGFGAVKADETLAMLARAIDCVQFLAIAGRSAELGSQSERVAQSHPGTVVPYGFVENMHELMAAADFMVTKSGGLTSSECLAMGLPMVIVNPIPGQEERNADFLLESGVALKANSPAHLVFKVHTLLTDGELLARMKRAALRVARPAAAYDIAEQVMSHA
jgi:processive 1,2-diacylglycerol beta-glucosyltransferase